MHSTHSVTRKYSVVIERTPEGPYQASFPAFPDYVTLGDTPEAALEMARELLDSIVWSWHDRGLELPDDVPVELHTIPTPQMVL